MIIRQYPGDDFSRAIQFKKNGADMNITGHTVYFVIKKSEQDAAATVTKTVTSHYLPLLGKTEITMTDAETGALSGTYYIWIKIKTPAGVTTTVLNGKIQFTYSARRATP
jgi:hypothetical protein